MSRLKILLPFLFALSLIATACASDGSAPTSPGQYPVQQNSVHFDGERYQLYWADQAGSLHRLNTRNLRLVQDPNNSTFLEVAQTGDPILHLRPDEPITVDGQDRQGAFSSPWFPFILGATLGNVFGGGRGGQTIVINNPAPGETRSYEASTPAYRYPPTGSVGRGDELHGSLDSSKAQLPDYSKVSPAPYATTGKSSGTGGGSAVSSKGSGSSSSVGAGSKGVLPSTSTSKPSTGLGGGGISSARGISGAKAPSVGRH
jgi:hypothetical protein